MTGTAFSPFTVGGGRKPRIDHGEKEPAHLLKGTLPPDCSLDLFIISLAQE